MTNQAAYLPSARSQLEVKDAPMPKPEANEVLIRNKVVAINPIDYKIQDSGAVIQHWPAILGFESSGIIEDIGAGVTDFKKGDRVAALSVAIRTNNPQHAAFQLYSTAPSHVVSLIPSSVTLTHAAVLPLSLATAAAGLYQPEFLSLDLPHVKPSAPNPEEKKHAILIWGGASAVGSSAIQLCHAANLFVVTTASAHNFDYVKDLGADVVVDYASSSAVDELIATVKAHAGRLIGCYDSISSQDTATKCAEVLHQFGGGKIASTGPRYPEKLLLGNVERVFVQVPASKSDGTKQPWMEVWHEFMGEGLETGVLKAKPEPIVKEGGLSAIQGAVDELREGKVSAGKLVVML